ncbi:MAG: DUF3325 domain-containing protein [Burkholderiaceae bacterium]
MSVAASFGLAYGAFVALALAMERHQEQIAGRRLGVWASRAWRCGGIVLLGSSLAVCLMQALPSMAVTVWLGLLSLAALALALSFTYRPAWVRLTAALSTLLACLAWLLSS